MSNFKGHYESGIIGGVLIIPFLLYCINIGFVNISYAETAVSSFIVMFFALFPDLDVKSKPSMMFYTILEIVLIGLYIYGYYQIAVIVAVVSIFPQLCKHRGILHSRIASILIPCSLFILPYNNMLISYEVTGVMASSGIIGYSIHLFMDRK
jgi:hypothetical protein